MPQTVTRLIINADDYGMHADINAGIRYCIGQNLIDAVSVAVCGPAAGPEELALLQSQTSNRPDIGIGIHLMLTEGIPVTTSISVAAPDGVFPPSVDALIRRYLLCRVREADIRTEWNAQMARLQKSGLPISRLDSHQHVHLLPGLWPIACDLAATNGVKQVRTGYQSLAQALVRFSPRLIAFQALALVRYWSMGINRLKTFGVLHSCNFILKKDRVAMMRTLQNGRTCELMVHPGFETDDLHKKLGHWHAHWNGEIEELKRVRRLAEEPGITNPKHVAEQ